MPSNLSPHVLATSEPSLVPISVVVPVFEGGQAFRACVSALMSDLRPHDELIVVADGESDGAWRECIGMGINVLSYSPNRGPAFARNRGAEAATHDLLFFVDADVVIRKGTLDLLRAAFEDPTLAGIVGSYDDAPAHGAFLSQYRNLLHHYTHQIADGAVASFWGACGAVRRSAFLRVGGFDERFGRPSIEDIDLGYRLTLAGYAVRLDRDLQVKHLKAWDAVGMVKTDVLARAAPWTELILRSRSIENNLNTRVSGLLSTAAMSLVPGFLLVLPFFPTPAATAIGLLIGVAIILNLHFYGFLRRQRGLVFALRAIPWHLFYFTYSGAGFVIGTAKFLTRSTPISWRPTSIQAQA